MKPQLNLEIRTNNTMSVQQITQWVHSIQSTLPFPAGYELSVALVGAHDMKQLNQQYRKKNTPTNVLSFAYDHLSGEVVLCTPVIRRQAKDHQVSFSEELLYLLCHGLLHLQGYDHEGSQTQAQRMERLEQRLMRLCFL